MAIFKLNDLGSFDELESLTARSGDPGREFDRVKEITADKGRVELDLIFSRSYEALFDMTPAEARRVAAQLVEAAALAEGQLEELQAARADADAWEDIQRLPRERKRKAAP